MFLTFKKIMTIVTVAVIATTPVNAQVSITEDDTSKNTPLGNAELRLQILERLRTATGQVDRYNNDPSLSNLESIVGAMEKFREDALPGGIFNSRIRVAVQQVQDLLIEVQDDPALSAEQKSRLSERLETSLVELAETRNSMDRLSEQLRVVLQEQVPGMRAEQRYLSAIEGAEQLVSEFRELDALFQEAIRTFGGSTDPVGTGD
ncbi:hypothetical protein [Pseudaestuariivita atlantica]|uniref:Uncharacterized protein n=1 Tax=Pseudaestuariivita atlantica TaxID=1317121 RepID=A0A0L1JS98_9RHOB|nr:hypothetical protein [Pseudaestuariivita atlantica]KNG94630.1 hypothetical protein ATO11_04300 [Pseudaestuariivita atlantica]